MQLTQDVLYRRGTIIVFKARHGYVVHNTKKDFEKGHTHFVKLHSAKSAARMAQEKTIPNAGGFYFLTSLQRISTDENYIRRIDERKKKLYDPNKERGKK